MGIKETSDELINSANDNSITDVRGTFFSAPPSNLINFSERHRLLKQ